MQYDIQSDPNFSIAQIIFEAPDEALVVESSAMVAKDSAVEMETEMSGSMLGGGEGLFRNTFTATEAGQTLWIAPPAEGDLMTFDMDGTEDVYISSSNFVAAGPQIDLDTEWQGGKGFFSGTSLFMIKARGQGPLFTGSYGGIHRVEVGSEGYIVDDNNIVAFTGGLDYSLNKVGGMMSFAGGGEGYVCDFHGQGTLWLSTRSAEALARFLDPYRPVQSGN